MIELIRMHVVSNNRRVMAATAEASRRPSAAEPLPQWSADPEDSSSTVEDGDSDGSAESDDSLDELFEGLPEFIKAGELQNAFPETLLTLLLLHQS